MAHKWSSVTSDPNFTVVLRKNSRIYISGHTGMLGSALIRTFRDRGYQELFTVPRQELDLTNKAAVKQFLVAIQPEVILMGAGRVGGIMENTVHSSDLILENLAIQNSLFATAVEVKSVTAVIYFGSSCIYPSKASQPMNEDLILSATPELTSIAYAVAKLAGVITCDAINQQHGSPKCLALIPASGYGPNDNFDPESGHVIGAMIANLHNAKIAGHTSVTLWGTGAPRRDFIYVDDIADAVELLLGKSCLPVGPLNLSSGQGTSIRDLAGLISSIVEYRGELLWDHSKLDGAAQKILDSARINELGWSPQTSLAEGIRKTYVWYLRQIANNN